MRNSIVSFFFGNEWLVRAGWLVAPRPHFQPGTQPKQMPSTYSTRPDLEEIVPARDLVAALDDDGDGLEDEGLYDTLAESAGRKVNSYLEGRYGHCMPFSMPPPALCRSAAVAFLAEAIYTRRPGADVPPKVAELAKEARESLKAIQKGKAHLHSGKVESSPVEAITEPNPAYSKTLNV